jgi:hypothetical protein
MGLGQTMVTIVAFAVLTVMFMNAYRVLTNADKDLLTAEAYRTAVDLGQSLMSEISTKKYDQSFNPPYTTTSGSSQNILNYFTQYNMLGPEYGEPKFTSSPDVSPFQSISRYNDVDDYNRYSRLTDPTNGLGRFRDSVLVYYVQMTNPPTAYSGRWWTKQVEVWVTNDKWLSGKWVKLYTIVGASTR